MHCKLTMKPSKQRTSGGGGGGRGGLRIKPTLKEVEVMEILLTLPILILKYEFLSRYSFKWGRKKKRSVLVPKSESSPLSTHRKTEEKEAAAAAAAEAYKSPSTPLCFLPSASGSDGADKSKQQQSYLKKNSKRKRTEDLMGKLDAVAQEREILQREIKAMGNLHQELTAKNLELKSKKLKIISSRNSENLQLWNNTSKMNMNQQQQQQHYRVQNSIFAPPRPPPPPPPPPHCHQFMMDLQPISCSSSNGGRLGLFNQMAPRVNNYGETFDFLMTPSQPLDQGMDNDLRVRAAAAAARQRRVMKRKASKNLAMKMSTRDCR